MTDQIRELASKAIDDLVRRLHVARMVMADKGNENRAEDFSDAISAILALCDKLNSAVARVKELEAENKKAWRERNEAVTRVKTWEAVVCLVEPFPSVRAVSIKEWGEGEGEKIGVQMPSPEKLTCILDEVAKFRRAAMDAGGK